MQTSPEKSNFTDILVAARAAAGNPRVLDPLRKLLAEAQEEVLRLEIPCRACGACCDFSAMDHRLFVSAAELALLAEVRPPNPPARLRCPYQHENLCMARDRRPLGCRVFYCNPASREPLHDLYERYHQRIATLHQEAGVPYVYAEMTGWLEAYWVES